MTASVANIGEQIELCISVKKTKMMLVNVNDADSEVMINGCAFEKTDKFTYLGSSVTKDNRVEKEVKVRIGKAANTMRRLQKVWRSKKLSYRTKMKLYNSTVLSALIYGAETWPVTLAMARKIDGFDSGCLMKILQIRRQDKVTNVEVRKRTGQLPTSLLLQKRCLRWFGHIIRQSDERLPRRAMQWQPVGKRRPWPSSTYMEANNRHRP
jgi:hypothetical protein